MILVDALQAHATTEENKTAYFLRDRKISVDEVFSPEGFLPLICRFAEKQLKENMTGAKETCGFNYIENESTIFGEMVEISSVEKGKIFENNFRLGALIIAASAVVGMGIEGSIDLTPVYDHFIKSGESNEESPRWPMYRKLN